MIRDLVVIGVGFPDIVQIIDDINNDKKQFNFLGFLDDNPNLKKIQEKDINISFTKPFINKNYSVFKWFYPSVYFIKFIFS